MPKARLTEKLEGAGLTSGGSGGQASLTQQKSPKRGNYNISQVAKAFNADTPREIAEMSAALAMNEGDWGTDADFRARQDEIASQFGVDPQTMATMRSNDNPLLATAQGINSGFDAFNNMVGGALDWGVDRFGDLVEGITDSQRAGDFIRNATTGEQLANIPGMAEYFIPVVGGVKGVTESVPQLYEAATGVDSTTGELLEGKDRAIRGLGGAANIVMSLIPGMGAARAGSKGVARGLTRSADDIAESTANAVRNNLRFKNNMTQDEIALVDDFFRQAEGMTDPNEIVQLARTYTPSSDNVLSGPLVRPGDIGRSTDASQLGSNLVSPRDRLNEILGTLEFEGPNGQTMRFGDVINTQQGPDWMNYVNQQRRDWIAGRVADAEGRLAPQSQYDKAVRAIRESPIMRRDPSLGGYIDMRKTPAAVDPARAAEIENRVAANARDAMVNAEKNGRVKVPEKTTQRQYKDRTVDITEPAQNYTNAEIYQGFKSGPDWEVNTGSYYKTAQQNVLNKINAARRAEGLQPYRSLDDYVNEEVGGTMLDLTQAGDRAIYNQRLDDFLSDIGGMYERGGLNGTEIGRIVGNYAGAGRRGINAARRPTAAQRAEHLRGLKEERLARDQADTISGYRESATARNNRVRDRIIDEDAIERSALDEASSATQGLRDQAALWNERSQTWNPFRLAEAMADARFGLGSSDAARMFRQGLMSPAGRASRSIQALADDSLTPMQRATALFTGGTPAMRAEGKLADLGENLAENIARGRQSTGGGLRSRIPIVGRGSTGATDEGVAEVQRAISEAMGQTYRNGSEVNQAVRNIRNIANRNNVNLNEFKGGAGRKALRAVPWLTNTLNVMAETGENPIDAWGDFFQNASAGEKAMMVLSMLPGGGRGARRAMRSTAPFTAAKAMLGAGVADSAFAGNPGGGLSAEDQDLIRQLLMGTAQLPEGASPVENTGALYNGTEGEGGQAAPQSGQQAEEDREYPQIDSETLAVLVPLIQQGALDEETYVDLVDTYGEDQILALLDQYQPLGG